MGLLEKHINITILFVCFSFTSFSQEVKLGLPGGNSNGSQDLFITPNNKNLLTTSFGNNNVMVWDTYSGKLINILTGHLESPEVFLSNDSKTVITADDSGFIKVWDLTSGTVLTEYKSDNVGYAIGNITVSNDFKYAAISHVGRSNEIIILELSTNTLFNSNFVSLKLIKTINVNEPHRILKFTHDSKSLNIISNDGNVTLWDIKNDTIETSTIKNVKTLRFSTLNDIALSKDDSNIYIFNLKKPKKSKSIKTDKKIVAFNINKSTDTLYYLDETGLFTIYNYKKNKIIKTFEIDLVEYASYDLKGTTLIQFSNILNLFKVIDITTGNTIHEENIKKGTLNSFTVKDDLVFMGTSKGIKILSYKNFETLNYLKPSTVDTHFANFFQNDSLFLYASNKKIVAFNFYKGNYTNVLEGHTRNISHIDFNSKQNTLLSTSYNQSILWDLKTFKQLKNTTYPLKDNDGETNVSLAKFSNTENKIVGSNYMGPLVYNLNNPEDYALFNDIHMFEIDYINVHKNNLISTIGHVKTCIWDIAANKLVTSFEHAPYKAIATFNDENNTIYSFVSTQNGFDIWDVKNGKLISTYIGHKNDVIEVKFNEDKSLLLAASKDLSIRVWNFKSTRLVKTFRGHNSKINSVNFSNDEKFLISSSNDGNVILWDFETEKALIKHYIFENNPKKWVHLHDSSLFDASPEAMEMMYWTKGLEVIEFSQLKDRYWLPGLWEKVMKRKKLPDVRNMSELKLQPIVEIQNITDNEVIVHLKKRDGGYGKVTLFINGKEAIKDIRPPDMDYSKKEQTITISIKNHPYLINGENKFTVKASSKDGFVQGRGAITVRSIKKKSLKKPQYFAVIIGVGEYANSQLNLKYTVNDAEAISKAMQLGAENLFGKDRTHIYTITTKTNKLPNKENIKEIFKEISSKANAEDIITVYLSGHGITWGGDQGDFYFLTSDATATSNNAYNDLAIRMNNTISTNEFVDWLKEIPALKQVMIIDACASGKAVDNLIAQRDIEPSQIKAIDRMKDRTGMYIISGSTADAVSYEASKYGQGLLTYSILQAIKGAALKEGKFVDIFTIMDYARETVPILAKGIGGIQEPQLLIPKGGSFDIGLLENKDKEAIPLANPKTVFIRSTLVNSEDFEDGLGLSELLNNELSISSSKGENSEIVYFDSANFPNACKISGGYTISENDISISLKISCGKELKTFNLESETTEELIKEIIKKVITEN